ncbi:MAG: TatD family hydrolase [Desulfobacteraceae bacterium]
MHPIIDTHTHLYDDSFAADRATVIKNARKVGVKRIITVSETLADARKNLELARLHPELLPTAGLYPTHLKWEVACNLHDFIRQHRNELVAIGEVGLDYWMVKDDEGKKIQRRIFESFVELSLELDLPLNVHSRSAGRHAVTLLLEKGARKVQLHAFDGKAGAALPAVEAGYFFSIPPSIQRSRQKQKLVRQLPLSSLLVETDSPVLGPDPDQRNEPANITHSIDAIAAIKNISPEKVIEVVYENTLRLYGKTVNSPVSNNNGI